MTNKAIFKEPLKTSTEEQILAGQLVDPEHTDNKDEKINFRVEDDGKIRISPDAQVAAGMPVRQKYTL